MSCDSVNINCSQCVLSLIHRLAWSTLCLYHLLFCFKSFLNCPYIIIIHACDLALTSDYISVLPAVVI